MDRFFYMIMSGASRDGENYKYIVGLCSLSILASTRHNEVHCMSSALSVYRLQFHDAQHLFDNTFVRGKR